MTQRHLVVLDVDGTLVHSLEAESLLFPQACEQALGITSVPNGFEGYRCPSDHGIVRELVEVNFGREPHKQEFQAVEDCFLELILENYAREPNLCRPVAGAVHAVSRLRESSEVVLSVATAGWRRTALHKLGVAGFDIGDLPMATSNDAEWKADIMRIAASRATEHYGGYEFESVVCFGDSKGDANAARSLGFNFIGIDTSGFVSDEEHVFDDFTVFEEIERTMFVVQKSRWVNRPANGNGST